MITVAVDPRLGAVLPAAAVRTVADASRVVLDASLPPDVAAVFARDLGAVPDPRPPRASDVTSRALDACNSTSSDDGEGVRLVAAPSPDAPAGTELLAAVAVMDRLRSPGGCPWDAEQTHASLLRYLVEETYELYDALAAGDTDASREELGDVLLQVLFHSRVAGEGEGYDVDDVARELVGKLVGRHPHVFADADDVVTAGDQDRRWEELKAAEKRRSSILEGVAAAQPGAALLAKYVSRARRAGVPADLLLDAVPGEVARPVVASAAESGDPEGALRAAATAFAERVRAAEATARADGADPTRLDAEGWRRHWA